MAFVVRPSVPSNLGALVEVLDVWPNKPECWRARSLCGPRLLKNGSVAEEGMAPDNCLRPLRADPEGHKNARAAKEVDIAIARLRRLPGEIVDAAVRAMSPRTRLFFFSHVLSPTGLVLPAKELCAEARRRGIITVVDGAHAPGMLDRPVVEGATFWVGSLHKWAFAPRTAAVLLDSDTLHVFPGDSLPGDTDITIGHHEVVVRARGYRDLRQEIHISPNSTLERPYVLSRRRSRTWYAAVGAGTIGVVGGVIALVAGSSGPEQLPGPPNPPICI